MPKPEIVSCSPDDALFSEVLQRIYGDNVHSPSHNDIDKDYLQSCLVMIRGKEVLGRLCIYRNDALSYAGKPVIVFGNFECIRDAGAAKALLAYGLDMAKACGAAAVIGPMNGSTWNQYRFIASGSGAPRFFTEQSHPGYYPALWEEAGFRPFQEYVSNIAPVPESHAADPAFFTAHELSVRGIDIPDLRRDLEALYPLCAAAFAGSPLYTPISKEQFVAKLSVLQPFLANSFTRLAINSAGLPVAFILCLRDVYDKSGKTVVLKTIARRPDCNIHGLMPALYKTVMSEASDAGYQQVIHAFMHVDNTSARRSRQFEGTTIKKYALYIYTEFG